ncbi:MAG: hypothetical protein HQK81_13275 [Desulfovibrionaceae bacterium]|nr:hypothetical protein [Desulfovibrionaceae bacterium]
MAKEVGDAVSLGWQVRTWIEAGLPATAKSIRGFEGDRQSHEQLGELPERIEFRRNIHSSCGKMFALCEASEGIKKWR